jgi:hypothetical protein
MKLFYYDKAHKIWQGLLTNKPSFKHYCHLIIPKESPYSVVISKFNSDTDGPSSYAVIASQTECPIGLNVHEFMAYQSLLSGKKRRWPQILIELGSSNLNFSSEATTFLIALLVLQVGPAHIDSPPGTVHKIFEDESFSRRLLDQLSFRLDIISSNWRETNSMETIITLILRLISMSTSVANDADQLLEKVRTITLQWITLLRSEILASIDSATARKHSLMRFGPL